MLALAMVSFVLTAAAESTELTAPDAMNVSTCSMTSKEISGVLSLHVETLDACVAAEYDRKPNASFPNRLPLAFVVQPHGRVENVMITQRHYRKGPLQSCIKRVFRKMRFPAGEHCPIQIAIQSAG